MAVILNLYVGVFLFDLAGEPCKEGGPTHACHILEAYLVGSVFYQVVNDSEVVLDRMNGGVGDGEGGL